MLDKLKTALYFLYNNEVRAFLFQLITLAIIGYIFYAGIGNMFSNIEERGIKSGFDFLTDEAGFDVAEHLIEYSAESTNFRVFLVGIINTLVVSGAAIVFASILGLIIGVARLSNNYIVSKLASTYVEIFRNIPILLQILFWYNIILISLPAVRNSINFFDGIFINLRGIFLPKPIFDNSFLWVVIAIIIGILAYIFIKKYFNKKHDKTGIATKTWMYFVGFIFIFPSLIFLLLGLPISFEYPALKGFNFTGGTSISPEFIALAFALGIYTATYISEAIRSGIESVDKGQKEAAKALGLTPFQSLKMIILPQALSVAIPPIINQYLNLTKNSSLAAAIGYSELVSVFTGTVLNNVGQAIEIILMTMAVYLTISLLISLLLNIVNVKMQFKSR